MNAFDDAAYNMAAVSATVALYRALRSQRRFTTFCISIISEIRDLA